MGKSPPAPGGGGVPPGRPPGPGPGSPPGGAGGGPPPGPGPGQGGRAEEASRAHPFSRRRGPARRPRGTSTRFMARAPPPEPGGGEETGKRFPVFIPARVGAPWRITVSSDMAQALAPACSARMLPRGGHGAGPGTDDHRVLPPGFVQRVLDHFVGDGVGEHHQQVGGAQPVFQGASILEITLAVH